VRKAFTYISYFLGAMMVLTGLVSLFSKQPRPEIATTGVTLIMATGLVGGRNGNGGK